MADSVVNVSGYDTSYGIDAYLVHATATTTDYRQIVAIGGDTSGAGSTATVTGGSLTTSSHDLTSHIKLSEIDTVLDTIKVDTTAVKLDMNAIKVDTAANEVLLTGIDTVLDNIKVDTEAIETATEAIQVDAAAIEVLLTAANVDHAANEVLLTAIDTVLDTIKVDTEAIETAVEGVLDVTVRPSISSYLSHVYLDLDAAGDNPATNTEVIAAPGSGNKLVIYGVQGSVVAAAASDYGNWGLTDGNASVATTLWTGRAQGTTNTQFGLTFPYGVALTANTALKVTSTEGSGNIFINAVIYYRTEAT
tara:strand:+ start:1891 stop:2808 length:918 start_codon:yes stop_codon:yes gene_type:complete